MEKLYGFLVEISLFPVRLKIVRVPTVLESPHYIDFSAFFLSNVTSYNICYVNYTILANMSLYIAAQYVMMFLIKPVENTNKTYRNYNDITFLCMSLTFLD